MSKSSNYQEAKHLVREYMKAMENTTSDKLVETIKKFTDLNYKWKGVYPHREQIGAEAVADSFWKPLVKSFTNLQRRQDVFVAGTNDVTGSGTWVMSMGYFIGLFDKEFLGVRPTGKIAHLRYAEFSHVENGKIVETGLFVDYIAFMEQSGANPLPPSTGHTFIYPGPKNHNGLLFEDANPKESLNTKNLVNQMVDDLTKLNKSGSMTCPPELLEKSWSKNMVWYGPGGIGASYTIPRYQLQHQLPFRQNLKDKEFNGHVVRFSEGNFACFFGWPNLSNTPIGGFLGLPGGEIRTDMQVVDVYCREGDKLSENWVLIDIPYWLKQQGLDIFKRTESILNPKY